MTQYTEGASFQHSPLTPSWMVLAPGRAACTGQIRTGPRNISKRHGIICHSSPAELLHTQIEDLLCANEQHQHIGAAICNNHTMLMQPMLGTDPSVVALQRMGITPWEHCLVVTTVQQGLEDGQYKGRRLLSRWAFEGCLAGELHVLHEAREVPASPELAGGPSTACQEHVGTLAKACPEACWECGHGLAQYPIVPLAQRGVGRGRGKPRLTDSASYQ